MLGRERLELGLLATERIEQLKYEENAEADQDPAQYAASFHGFVSSKVWWSAGSGVVFARLVRQTAAPRG